MTAGLTGIRTAPSLSSGRDWAMQTDGRSPAADAAVTSSEASSQGVRRCLAWWGGRGCRDGAPGLLKGTREGPWPRWFSSAAAGAFGEENRGGGECSGKREGAAREEEERGDTRRRRGVARETGGSRRWPGHRQRSPPSSFGARGGRRQEKGGLGRAGPVLLGHQVGFTGKSRWFCSLFFFYNSVLFFFYLILLPLF